MKALRITSQIVVTMMLALMITLTISKGNECTQVGLKQCKSYHSSI